MIVDFEMILMTIAEDVIISYISHVVKQRIEKAKKKGKSHYISLPEQETRRVIKEAIINTLLFIPIEVVTLEIEEIKPEAIAKFMKDFQG